MQTLVIIPIMKPYCDNLYKADIPGAVRLLNRKAVARTRRVAALVGAGGHQNCGENMQVSLQVFREGTELNSSP